MEPDRLSRELTEKLEAARMTAEALSLKAGLARDSVGRWIRGTTVPTLASLQAVETVLASRLGYAVDLAEHVTERRHTRRPPNARADPEPPPPTASALSGLPAASAAFAGRDGELSMLLGVLGHSGEGPQAAASSVMVTAVGGLAGIGKTELAVQAARTAVGNGWFPGGTLFADMFGYDHTRRVEPAQALEGFLHALGVPAKEIPPGLQDRTRLYTSILAGFAGQGRRILVIIDNVSSHEQAAPLLPTDGTTAAIVTSRHTLGMLDAMLLDLNVLAEGNAVDLMERALRVRRPSDTRIRDHPGDARQIARLCGGLPLALRIITGLLAADPARPLAAMAADMSSTSSRLDELQYDHEAVRAAFDLSYQHLDELQARMFRLFAVNPGPDISTQASAILAGTDNTNARRALESLARAHLIEPASTPGRWQMHDLVRLYAQRLASEHAESDGLAQARDHLLQHYLRLASAANQHLLSQPGGPEPGEFASRESALEWLDAERPNLMAAITMAAAGGHDHVARELPFRLGVYLDWRRRFGDWLTATAVSVEAARRLGDRHREADALNNLGLALRNLRRFGEAAAAHQDAAAIYRQTGDRHAAGRALNNLGIALQEMNRLGEAIEAHQDAVASHHQADDRLGEGSALNNLGLALTKAGRIQEAIAACQDAITRYRETGDRHSEGRALGSLGLALQEAGQFDQAITAHREDLAISQETGDRHGEAVAHDHLAQALQAAGRPHEAITAYVTAATIYREADDENGENQALSKIDVIRREQATRNS